jgi:hypothetical protein
VPVRPMPRKYGNTKVEVDGYIFDSKREAQYYQELKYRKMAGEIKEIRRQPKYELMPRFKYRGKTILPITYTADFEITLPDGRKQVIDVKGMRTQQYIIRVKLLKFKYPDVEFLEVK